MPRFCARMAANRALCFHWKICVLVIFQSKPHICADLYVQLFHVDNFLHRGVIHASSGRISPPPQSSSSRPTG